MDREPMLDPIPTEALLEPMPDLRRLARRLVRDGHRADDLVQSAYVAALLRPPRIQSKLRAWLTRVVTNLAREDARRGSRRERRESVAASPEALASTSDLVVRHDSRMQLMQAVRALDEPYREAILLRYLEDLPPRHIAARLGVPVKTIDSRLRRGLDQLRAQLDTANNGDRRAWLVAFAPLARAPEVAAASSLFGVLLVNTTLSALAVVAVVATTWFFVQRDDSPPLSQAPLTTPSSAAMAPADTERLVEPTRASTPPPEPAQAASKGGLAPSAIAGKVIDVDGKLVGDVALHAIVQGSAAPATAITSDRDGNFTLDAIDAAQDVTCVDTRYAAVLDAKIPAGAQRTAADLHCVVIVARTTPIEGIVVDADGRPIDDARVELLAPESVRARFPFDLSANSERERAVTTRADGRFAFADAPQIPGVRCSATRVGFDAAAATFERFPQTNVTLVLHRAERNLALTGVVFGRDGTPLADARVALGNLPATTDEHGQFTFEYPADAPPASIVAVARGLLPVTLDRPAAGWPTFVELHLQDAPKALAGIVYGPDGKACAGASVWIDDPTTFGSWDRNFWVAECIISGDGALQRGTTTDSAGHFRLEGLTDRTYSVRAMIPKLAWQIEAGNRAAGDERVEIRFPADGLHRSIAGVVHDFGGAPVAGATVQVVTMLKAAEDPVSKQKFFNSCIGSSAVTDANGAFELHDVPVAADLDVYGDGLVFQPQWTVPEHLDGPIELRVARACKFRVELAAAPAAAVTFQLVDATGALVPVTRSSPSLIEELWSAPLVDGASEVLMAMDSVHELVLFDAASAECARVPATLIPGETTVIR